MDEQSVAQKEVIHIEQLQRGMFVEAIVAQRGHLRLNHPRLILSQQYIEMLKRKGVQSLRVNWQRSQVKASEALELTSSVPRLEKLANDENIRSLYQALKHEQACCFEQLKSGQEINLASLSQLAERLLERLHTQADNLLLLAKMREKNHYLMEHSLNVGVLLAHFAQALKLNYEEQRQLLLGGLLHDIGKMALPMSLLNKLAPLTAQEHRQMREHVLHSQNMLMNQRGFTQIMCDVIVHHHERIDGQGYPSQLQGARLSLYARMAAIVDSFDALSTDRPHQSAMAPAQAFQLMLQHIDTQFDRLLLERFIRCMGVYPVGTLVKLADEHLALVVGRNASAPLRPALVLLYDGVRQQHLEPISYDLNNHANNEIVSAVSARDYQLDFNACVRRVCA